MKWKSSRRKELQAVIKMFFSKLCLFLGVWKDLLGHTSDQEYVFPIDAGTFLYRLSIITYLILRIKMGIEKFKKSTSWLKVAEKFRIHD